MKKLLITIALLFPLTASAQLAGVESIGATFGLYICNEEDTSECVILAQDGTIYKRSPPIGRRAIDWDMQNWQYSKQRARALPDGDEKEAWEQDSLYWQVRLLADKAWLRHQASITPPLFLLFAAPEHRDPVIADYVDRYTRATRLVIIMENFFGLPNNAPVGRP